MRPLLPFPLPLSLGTDICRVSRIASLLAHPTRGPRFVERVLAPEERGLPRVRSVLERGIRDGRVAEFIAGRFVSPLLLSPSCPVFFLPVCLCFISGALVYAVDWTGMK